MSAPTKQLAALTSPTIEAACYQLLRLPSAEKAAEQLETIRQHYVTSKKQPKDQENPAIKLWIRDFMVTEEEAEEGRIGNFALIQYTEIEEGVFTLYAEKIDVPVRHHPKKRYVTRPHPNFSHPVIKKILENHTYPTIEDAQQDLQNLHQEFPDTSIPTNIKYFVMLYDKERHGKAMPVKKYVLEIQALDEGGFRIDMQENEPKPETKTKTDKKTDTQHDDAPAEPVGKFSSMVALKRAKKGKPAPTKLAQQPPRDDDD